MTAIYRLLAELGVATLALVGAFLMGHHGGYTAGAAAVQSKWNEANAISSAAAASASEANRAEEQRRNAASQEIVANAQAQTVVVATAAGRALDSLAGLRQRAATVAAACDRPASDPPATPGSASNGVAADLQTDLLGRVGEAAGQLAAVADRWRVESQACAAWADSLKR